jgi:hypothetical protein
LKKKFGKVEKLKYGYLQKYAEFRKTLGWLKELKNYEMFKIDIPQEKHARRIYEARLFIEGGHSGSS